MEKLATSPVLEIYLVTQAPPIWAPGEHLASWDPSVAAMGVECRGMARGSWSVGALWETAGVVGSRQKGLAGGGGDGEGVRLG